MKKITSLAMLLAAGTFALTSCSDDNDSNPTLVTPTSFTVNTPAVGEALVDLQTSSAIDLTWSQPRFTDLGAPLIPTYTVQVSAVGTFDKAFDEDLEDNSGADFIALPETYSTGTAAISTASLDRALVQLLAWEEDNVPATLPLSIRVKAAVQDASFNEYGTIYSNVIKLNTAPYYIELSDADPEIWYLIGGDIGDGKWTSDVPSSTLPMQTVDGFEYDKKTGRGEITWTGYLAANGFKLKQYTTTWDYQWGQGASFGTFVKNDGGSGNITVPKAGYYTVTLDTQNDKLTVTAYDGNEPTVFGAMCMSGSFNGWGDTYMLPVHTYDGAKNHDWYASVDLTTGAELKFKQEGSWDFNRGGALKAYSEGYYGYGTQNGPNIVIAEDAHYIIIFNDITGFYRLIKQ